MFNPYGYLFFVQGVGWSHLADTLFLVSLAVSAPIVLGPSPFLKKAMGSVL